MTQMTAFTAAYADDGADPLLVDCLIMADSPESISACAFRLGIERYEIVTATGRAELRRRRCDRELPPRRLVGRLAEPLERSDSLPFAPRASGRQAVTAQLN